jgi:hypothetical protein
MQKRFLQRRQVEREWIGNVRGISWWRGSGEEGVVEHMVQERVPELELEVVVLFCIRFEPIS